MASLAALGVVFGDIGTSPLYAMRAIFNAGERAVAPDATNVYGVVSMILWAITLVVSVKYVALVMRADNNGEGGILALAALLRRVFVQPRRVFFVTLLGIIGAGLFYGDSVITPAISVMSAVEGLEVMNPRFITFVVPIALVILTGLFAIQRFGTAKVGRLLGPVMLLWFGALAALGVPHIIAHPGILRALSPTYAIAFAIDRPMLAVAAMAGVVLTITGAEALYADMGHFGPRPIRLSWFVIVFPCLALNYLGQGALLSTNPGAIDNPFFRLVPEPIVIPLVVLATAATVIASQSVISGAFSMTNQALHLGLLPRLTVKHSSKESGGQIYIPAINAILFIGVFLLIIGFQSSEALSHAYGLAVTGTLVLTTTLFAAVARKVWNWHLGFVAAFVLVVGGLELAFFTANLSKIVHGGWLPILIAALVIFVMTTWMWGVHIVHERRASIEPPIGEWLEHIKELNVPRVPGQAIFLHGDQATVPLALKETRRFNHVIHERVAIVTVEVLDIPHVRHVDRVEINEFGDPDDGIVGIVIRLGFNDNQDVPHNLKWSEGKDVEFVFDPVEARYYLSLLHVSATEGRGWSLFRKRAYLMLGRLAGPGADAFHLPPQRTVILGGTLHI